MNPKTIQRVAEAGVVGAGGAGFPTHVKLQAKVERVLANGASCEPLLMSDPFLMEEEADRILQGLLLVMECTEAPRGTLCLKGKHRKALAVMQEKVGRGAYKDIDLFELGDFYPAGDEQVLVYEVLGRVVPEGGLPLQVGAVVSNVETLLNIARAVDEGRPVTERYLTVGGEVAEPLILKVPLGLSVGEVIGLAGGARIQAFRVVLGGPMMGRVVSDLATPVDKTTSGVLVLAPDHPVVRDKVRDPARLRNLTRLACCQCSRCTDMCPRYLLGHSLNPHKIMRQIGSTAPAARAVQMDALICSECGVCEKYACPMMISPREVNAQIKKELLAAGGKRAPKKEAYQPSAFREERKIPTRRLLDRLQLSRYDGHPRFDTRKIVVNRVEVPLKQHLGAPARPVVKPGDRVKAGELLGEIPEKALGARVHASLSGRVTAVDGRVIIQAGEG
ncbi:MAG: 4Fe-4S dicluster domain-containing protein [Deltaproteobacteria bacterium]|nr:4Fe-4S dicluster domain-containing protein [Deltaproteobacteria bacterium]